MMADFGSAMFGDECQGRIGLIKESMELLRSR